MAERLRMSQDEFIRYRNNLVALGYVDYEAVNLQEGTFVVPWTRKPLLDVKPTMEGVEVTPSESDTITNLLRHKFYQWPRSKLKHPVFS